MKALKIAIGVCYTVFAVIWTVIGVIFALYTKGVRNFALLGGYYVKIPTAIILAVLAVVAIIFPFCSGNMKLARRYRALVAAGIYIIIAALTVLGCRQYYSVFTPQKWKDNMYLRYLMIDSFEKNYINDETNKDDIMELLGYPDGMETGYGDDEYPYVIDEKFLIDEKRLDYNIYYVVFENNVVVDTYDYQSIWEE